jgi:hypothetical protein
MAPNQKQLAAKKRQAKNTLNREQIIVMAAALNLLHKELQLLRELYLYHQWFWYRHHDTRELYDSYQSRLALVATLEQQSLALWWHFNSLSNPVYASEKPAKLTKRIHALIDELPAMRTKILELYKAHSLAIKCKKPLSDQVWNELTDALVLMPDLFKKSFKP